MWGQPLMAVRRSGASRAEIGHQPSSKPLGELPLARTAEGGCPHAFFGKLSSH